MKHLTDDERAELIERVLRGLEDRGSEFRRTEFLERLVLKAARRSPRHEADIRVRKSFREAGEAPPDWSPRDEDWYREVVPPAIEDMAAVLLREDFLLIEKIVVDRDEDAFSDMVDRLNSHLKIRGMLYNQGVNPDTEYPKVLSKIWEAMAKWDGRDFIAYVARSIKNYCIDQWKARRKAFSEMPEVGVEDARPESRTRDQAEARDAVEHVLAVVTELETEGTIGPLDSGLFSLILKGRGVTELVEQLDGGPVVPALKEALPAVLTKKKLDRSGALALQYLAEGLSPREVKRLTRVPREKLEVADRALESARADLDLTLALCRARLTETELKRAGKLTANAINLRINRLRLKVWQALCDRAYDQLRRRKGALDEVDLAIVRHRCTADNQPPCKMYKDASCKREADPELLLEASGLALSRAELRDRMSELRDRVIDEVGRLLPDYNSCLYERKTGH